MASAYCAFVVRYASQAPARVEGVDFYYDGVVVHWSRRLEEDERRFNRFPDHRNMPRLTLADEAGTAFRTAGSRGGTETTRFRSQQTFVPGVPDGVSWLDVTLEQERIRIPLEE